MLITEVFPLGRSRYRISIDNRFAFVLYKGELAHYDIKLDEQLSDEDYEEITKTVLPKRAKKRAMNLLMKKDYTEYSLRRKLQEGFYPEEVMDEAIDYVKGYGYVDDGRFARTYISYYAPTKPYKDMEKFLLQKGVAKDIIKAAYEEVAKVDNVPDEFSLGKRLLDKKTYQLESGDMNERRKAFSYLVRKGISTDVAMKLLDITRNNV